MLKEGSSFFTLPAMHSGARSAKPKHECRTPKGPPTHGVLYIECRKRAGEPSEYLLSFGGDKDGVGVFYLAKATSFDSLTALLRKIGVLPPAIATALQVLMSDSSHKIPNILLTPAMLRDLDLI